MGVLHNRSAQTLILTLALAGLGSALIPSPALARSGTLAGQHPGHPVTVRLRPKLHAPTVYQGYVGNLVTIVGQTRQRDGYLWYEVQFSEGQQGWVRQDYLRETMAPGSAGLGGVPVEEIWNATQAIGQLVRGNSDIGSPAVGVWTQASPQSPLRYLAQEGDRVQILGQSPGDDGYLWYFVSLRSQGRGWVRADNLHILENLNATR